MVRRRASISSSNLVERLTDKYITHKIPGKDAPSVKIELEKILAEYGEKVDRDIQDNHIRYGSEFASGVDANELLAADVYFAHPPPPVAALK